MDMKAIQMIKQDDVGRNFVEILNKNGYITDWTEECKR